MPIGPAHKRQRSKNWFMLAVLLAWVAAVYYLAIIKIGGV